jgi:hypothetical protein
MSSLPRVVQENLLANARYTTRLHNLLTGEARHYINSDNEIRQFRNCYYRLLTTEGGDAFLV